MTRAEELAEKVRSRFAPIDGTATKEIERLDGLDWDEADAALSELVALAGAHDDAHWTQKEQERLYEEVRADAEALAEAAKAVIGAFYDPARRSQSLEIERLEAVLAHYRGEK